MSRIACVTGATGFLGRRLVRSLCQNDDVEVRCLVRSTSDTTGIEDTVPLKHLHRVKILRGDLSDSEFVRNSVRGADVVYHLAASLSGSTSTMFLNTVIPTRQLMTDAAAANVGRFVLISSLGVYGTEELKTNQELTEEAPIDPHPADRDAYTFSKIRQEQVARELAEELKLPLVVVRPGVIYGPGRTLLTSRVGLKLGPMLIQMGSQTLPYTFVENCADAIALAGLEPDVDGETFNIVDDDLPTGSQLLKFLKKRGQSVRTLPIPRFAIGRLSALYHWYSRFSDGQLPPVITRYKSNAIWKSLKYSNQKAKERLHWQPAVSTEEALRRALV